MFVREDLKNCGISSTTILRIFFVSEIFARGYKAIILKKHLNYLTFLKKNLFRLHHPKPTQTILVKAKNNYMEGVIINLKFLILDVKKDIYFVILVS